MLNLRLIAAVSVLGLLSACGTGGPSSPNQGTRTSRPAYTAKQAELDAARFKGQTATEIVASLGDPSFRRRETPAEVWQYYGQGCVLDLFLYDEKGGQRVAHAELHSRNFNDDPSPDCLPLLLQGKRQPVS